MDSSNQKCNGSAPSYCIDDDEVIILDSPEPVCIVDDKDEDIEEENGEKNGERSENLNMEVKVEKSDNEPVAEEQDSEMKDPAQEQDMQESTHTNGKDQTDESAMEQESNVEDEQESAPKNGDNAGPQKNNASQEKENPDGEEQKEDDEYDEQPCGSDMGDFEVRSEAGGSDTEGETMARWDCDPKRRTYRTYTFKDLKPTEPDPRCKKDFPLAPYWPVYVGNFRLFRKYSSDQNCTYAVHKYFASKGLPALMVYRLKDGFYETYQRNVGLYDMLVYFCCQEDAQRAVCRCNRDLYYGHRLTVLDGRKRISLYGGPTIRYRHLREKDRFDTETNLSLYFENQLRRPVRWTAKHDLDTVLVNYRKPLLRNKQYRIDGYEEVFMNPGRESQRQRFVEEDIESSLLLEIKNNPRFMELKPRFKWLNSLMHGVIPEMSIMWQRTEVEREVPPPPKPAGAARPPIRQPAGAARPPIRQPAGAARPPIRKPQFNDNARPAVYARPVGAPRVTKPKPKPILKMGGRNGAPSSTVSAGKSNRVTFARTASPSPSFELLQQERKIIELKQQLDRMVQARNVTLKKIPQVSSRNHPNNNRNWPRNTNYRKRI